MTDEQRRKLERIAAHTMNPDTVEAIRAALDENDRLASDLREFQRSARVLSEENRRLGRLVEAWRVFVKIVEDPRGYMECLDAEPLVGTALCIPVGVSVAARAALALEEETT